MKDLKLFRILVILMGLSAMLWDMPRFINSSLVSLFKAQANYTCCKDYLFWLSDYLFIRVIY